MQYMACNILSLNSIGLSIEHSILPLLLDPEGEESHSAEMRELPSTMLCQEVEEVLLYSLVDK